MQLLDLEAREGAEVYDCGLVLSRPDQHVAWRGDACADDCDELVERIRGAKVESRRIASDAPAALAA